MLWKSLWFDGVFWHYKRFRKRKENYNLNGSRTSLNEEPNLPTDGVDLINSETIVLTVCYSCSSNLTGHSWRRKKKFSRSKRLSETSFLRNCTLPCNSHDVGELVTSLANVLRTGRSAGPSHARARRNRFHCPPPPPPPPPRHLLPGIFPARVSVKSLYSFFSSSHLFLLIFGARAKRRATLQTYYPLPFPISPLSPRFPLLRCPTLYATILRLVL